MKDTKKGVLHLVIALITILLLAGVALVGIGAQHKGSAKNIKLGLDLAGGVSITYQAVKEDPTSTEMEDTVYKMQKRVENYSTEAEVYKEGTNRVNIDIPNVKDPNEILDALGKAGSLEFLDPEGKVVLDGSDIETAKAQTQQDQNSGVQENVVKLTMKSAGAKKFREATAANIGKAITIMYDGKEVSSPNVESEISDGVAIISGSFDTFEKADELASVIRIGALPLELKEIRSNVVGAKLGKEAINTSLLAGAIGFGLVVLFMMVMFRVPGFASSIALVFYVGILSFVLNAMDVTLTLPGIAGIILSIGMAVDANVIIFTRIREEIASGKTVRSSIKLGFEKALSAIVDGNVTTLIAAAVLWFKGSGSVKGFAQTLAIGVILSMFTALVVTKFILYAFYNCGVQDEKYYGIQKERKTIDFIGNWKKFMLISGTLVLICVGAIIYNVQSTGAPFKYGLDFQGGTSTQITFDEGETIDSTVKQKVVEMIKLTTGATAEVADVEGTNAIVVKTVELDLEKRKAVDAKLTSDFGISADNIQTESISATVSGEMKSDAVVAVVIAVFCMLLYIWIRFKNIHFGASAVFSLLHDVIVVILVYAVFSRFIAVGGTFIACMLTIVGYSINATVVIFDRIRENTKDMKKKDTFKDIVNRSITQTLGRSIYTNLTTFFMVLMLVILGVDSVRQFAIPLAVGITCGAYTSVCVTGPMLYWLKTKVSKKNS